MSINTGQSSKNETVARAMQILLLFRDQKELGLRDMARQVQLSTSVVYRMVDTLCDYGFLRQVLDSKKYTLGPSLLELGNRVRVADTFLQVCMKHMDALRDRTSETVALHVYRNGLRVNVLESQSPQPLRHVMSVGESYPLTHGASDIIIRAMVDDEELRLIDRKVKEFGMEGRPPTRMEIDHFRRQGWATSDGARTSGAMAVAAPVPHPQGLYVLSLLGPRERILKAGVRQLASEVVATAQALRMEIGDFHASL